MRAETPFSTWMRGVHLHEEGVALPGHDPFPGAHVVVAYLAGHGQGVVYNVVQYLGRVKGVLQSFRRKAGGHLNAFLPPRGLNGTVARAEMHRVCSAAVRNHLHFQVIKIGDALLDKHALVLELAQGVAAHAPEHRAELVRSYTSSMPMPPPPAEALTNTRGRLMPCWAWNSKISLAMCSASISS